MDVIDLVNEYSDVDECCDIPPPLIVCLECGLTDTNCINVVCVDSIDDVGKCSCGKFSLKYDLVCCNGCQKQLCIRCQWETNYRFYCEACASTCTICASPTYFYKGTLYACRQCGIISCPDCKNAEGLCDDCEHGTDDTDPID